MPLPNTAKQFAVFTHLNAF